MKDKPEFYITISVFCVFLTLLDIAYFQYSILHKTINNKTYQEAGMMEYINPVDKRPLYIPIYIQKGDN